MTLNFTKRVETQYGFVNFYFNRIYTVDGIRYHISCKDKKGKTYEFQLFEMLGQWIFTNNSKCPLWIKALEKDFERAILQSLAK
jgi:hypothetical protein